MFPVRYEMNSYILFRRNSVFNGLITFGLQKAGNGLVLNSPVFYSTSNQIVAKL
jgi:hypothetical protein